MRSPWRSPIASIRSTIVASWERGTVASSSSVTRPSRDSEGSAARRASMMPAASTASVAILTSSASSARQASAIRSRSRATPSGPPSWPKISTAPASRRRPMCAKSSTVSMQVASRNSSVAGRTPLRSDRDTARPAAASEAK